MLVSAHNAAIDQEPFEVWILESLSDGSVGMIFRSSTKACEEKEDLSKKYNNNRSIPIADFLTKLVLSDKYCVVFRSSTKAS